MSAAREPALPAGSDQASSRLAATLRELSRALISSGAFLQRGAISPVLEPGSSAALSLRPGDLNRIKLTASGKIYLPPITAAIVGAPVLVAVILGGAFTCQFLPSARAIDPRTAPTINGLASFTATAAGLYSFVTDGQRWFV